MGLVAYRGSLTIEARTLPLFRNYRFLCPSFAYIGMVVHAEAGVPARALPNDWAWQFYTKLSNFARDGLARHTSLGSHGHSRQPQFHCDWQATPEEKHHE